MKKVLTLKYMTLHPLYFNTDEIWKTSKTETDAILAISNEYKTTINFILSRSETGKNS